MLLLPQVLGAIQRRFLLRSQRSTVLSTALSRSKVRLYSFSISTEVDLFISHSGSLCASKQCGQPIEGPCLLTADNKRYHPGHLACDHGSGHRPCDNPMIDYFEIGSLKVCERHKDAVLSDTIRRSRKPGRSSGSTPKAEKRRTRLIDSSKLKPQ